MSPKLPISVLENEIAVLFHKFLKIDTFSSFVCIVNFEVAWFTLFTFETSLVIASLFYRCKNFDFRILYEYSYLINKQICNYKYLDIKVVLISLKDSQHLVTLF